MVLINTCGIDHLDGQDETGLPWGWHAFSTFKDRQSLHGLIGTKMSNIYLFIYFSIISVNSQVLMAE